MFENFSICFDMSLSLFTVVDLNVLQFFPAAEESIDYYNQKRCFDGKGLVLPSQIVSSALLYDNYLKIGDFRLITTALALYVFSCAHLLCFLSSLEVCQIF